MTYEGRKLLMFLVVGYCLSAEREQNFISLNYSYFIIMLWSIAKAKLYRLTAMMIKLLID